MAKRNKDLNIPDGIFEAINRHEYDNLKTFLDNTDWYSFTPQFIIPREDIRRLVRIIKDEEVRRDVMNYLKRYASDYFRDGAQEIAIDRGGVYIESELERRTDEIMDDFKKELAFQIDLIESNGQFSGDRFNKLEKKIKDLEKQIKETLEENIKLKEKINRYENPWAYGKYIPDKFRTPIFQEIIEALQKKRIVLIITKPNSYGYPEMCCFRWLGNHDLFGYFVDKISYEFELRDSGGRISWAALKPAVENYDEIIRTARNAVSKYTANPKAKQPETADDINEVLKIAFVHKDELEYQMQNVTDV